MNPNRVFAFSVVFLILHFLITGAARPGPHSPGSGAWLGTWPGTECPQPRGARSQSDVGAHLSCVPSDGSSSFTAGTVSPVTAQAPALHEGSLLHDVLPFPLPCLLFLSQGWSRWVGATWGRGEGKGSAGVWGSGWGRAGGHSLGWGQAWGPLGHCGVLFHPRARGCPPGPPKLPPWLQPALGGFAAPPGSVAPARRNLK